jgi:hypothetical protein
MFHSWLTELVGRSRPTTAGGKAKSERLANDPTTNELDLEKAATTGDVPFTAEELTRKLTAAKLEDRK